MNSRNDPSSLSFGARLKQVEMEAAASKRKVRELEETSLDQEQKADANERRRMKRQETARASSMLAGFDTSLAELESVDQSMLPKAQRFLIQQEIVAKQFASATPAVVHLTDDAWQRIRNWQAAMPADATFEMNNSRPESTVNPATTAAHNYYRSQRQARAERQRVQNSPDPQASAKSKAKIKVDEEYRRKNGKDLSNPFSQSLDS